MGGDETSYPLDWLAVRHCTAMRAVNDPLAQDNTIRENDGVETHILRSSVARKPSLLCTSSFLVLQCREREVMG